MQLKFTESEQGNDTKILIQNVDRHRRKPYYKWNQRETEDKKNENGTSNFDQEEKNNF